ncbi:MAG: hypothetical protein M3228_06970 [Actinomycetota bacterium]|nr:hypothetical protein [Actinomycetota bacterium]
MATQERQEAYPVDALQRAEQVLARARARRADIVTPDSATSPMDQANTVQIPLTMVAAADPRAAEPDDTIIVPNAVFGREVPARRDVGSTRPHR